MYVDDATSHKDFMARKSVVELSLRMVACVPLRTPKGVDGALYVDSRSIHGSLEGERLQLLEAFAAHAAVALDRAEHPYTQGLLSCLPRIDGARGELPVLVRDPAWLVG